MILTWIVLALGIGVIVGLSVPTAVLFNRDRRLRQTMSLMDREARMVRPQPLRPASRDLTAEELRWLLWEEWDSV